MMLVHSFFFMAFEEETIEYLGLSFLFMKVQTIAF